MALDRIVVVLVRTEGPLNLGSVARLCGNYGCALRLVDVVADAGCREAVMMAHPSERQLEGAARFSTLAAALADVELAVGTSSKIVQARDAPPLTVERARLLQPGPGGKLALVFGNERLGLKREEAALCHRVMRLETPGDEPSLNLSHAVSAVLQVMALSALAAAADGAGETRAAPSAREALLTEWLATLEAAGYFKAQTPAGFAPRLREIVDKMDVSDRDVELLRGMLRVFGRRAAPPDTPPG
jgi:tRNA/rRNA methyltransferase